MELSSAEQLGCPLGRGRPLSRVLRPVNAEPSNFDWVIAVFVMTIQQGAFISTPLILSEVPLTELTHIQNPFNTVGIAISFVLIGIVCFPWIRQIGFLALSNKVPLFFMLLVLMSATWSIHPDLTIRRGMGYVLTVLIAAYLSVRFDVVDRMKTLSASFAISAIGSLVFVAAFPDFGIMQVGDLAGTWRGVFPHKNVLGPVMAVAVFTELFILVACKGRPRWRLVLLGTFFALVVLSRSVTALLLSLAYLAGTCVYLVWRRDRWLGAVISIVAVLFLFEVLIVAWSDPDGVLGVLGRDTNLTGRTELWPLVIEAIAQRPLLGWGYRAAWQANDDSTILIETGWGASSAHNAFLEIILQLGLVGAAVMLAIIGIALWRGLRCCKAGSFCLGWFSLIFFAGAILAAQTMETLGKNQIIEWVVFNVLSFSCGISLAARRSNRRADVHSSPIHRMLARPLGH